MDYIKSAQNQWALKKPSLDRKPVTEKNKVHIAYLNSELKKTHKKLNSICRKEASDLLDISTRTDENKHSEGQKPESAKHLKLEARKNSCRTNAAINRSPQISYQRAKALGPRKTSIPSEIGVSYSKAKKARLNVTRQINLSPHSDHKDRILTRSRFNLTKTRLKF